MSRQFDYEKFEKWENETHIPEDVMAMVDIVCKELGIPVVEETLKYKNRGGYTYAYCKGFILSQCTSSLANGPDMDMTTIFMKWLGGLGFEVSDSYGDNGLDSATNWHDTYWYKEISYKPTMKYADDFYVHSDDEDEDYDEYEDERDYYGNFWDEY
jgi:hypothetical protein